MSARAFLSLFLTATVLYSCGAGADRRDDLPVSRVVLYQNGIGYFERYGTFEGKELKLRIRPDQINDILASLTVIDLDRKKGASSVSLPVEKSNSMILGELPPQVRDAGGLLAVMQAFRGAEIDVDTKKGSVAGRIVGVESFGEEGARVTILTSDEELVPVKLDDITRVQLEDRTLTVGLEKALDVSLGEGTWKPVEVVVHFPDDGEHKILMSYLVAMPTWKPAYRLIFGKEGADKVRLQGWAVIDNVSGEDWTDVDLSLTAGSPISFVVDLHTPRMPSRPDLTGRTYTANNDAPPVPMDSFATGSSAPAAAEKERSRRSRKKGVSAKADRGGDADAIADEYYAPEPSPAPSMDSSLMAQGLAESVTGEKVGALFRYDVPLPVTVPDASSALVTIVNADIEGEDVLLYDPTASARAQTHPYRAVRLTNSTDMVLERGPLTIYKDGTFVGEGLTSQIGAGQTTFIPYSLEPGVHIERAYDYGAQEQKLVKILDGVATVEAYQLQTINFTITSHQSENQAVYLRVDKASGFELREPAEAIVQGEVYYVKMDADAGGVTKHKVVQAQRSQASLALFDPAMQPAIELYINDVNANPAVKAQLEGIIQIQRKIGEAQHRMNTISKRQDDLRRRSADLRQNIKVLGASKANESLHKDLIKKLGKAEAELADIDRESVELGETKYALEVEMREAFNAITLDPQ